MTNPTGETRMTGLQETTRKLKELGWNDEAIRKAAPPQRTEQNFCSRCGKRTPDVITIHTCTPPKENT